MDLDRPGHPLPIPSVALTVNGRAGEALDGEPLADLLDRLGERVPHVCYQPAFHSVQQLGAPQTCDTCLVRVDGELVRACATPVRAGMVVEL
ncbi:MAG: hypothetical protein HKN04_03455 [Rhodothermaceae bacterium]|nr:hypothetical protein [Rhodothermaceae bacterium]